MKALVAAVVLVMVASSSARADDEGYRKELVIVDSVAAGTVGGAAAAGVWLFSKDDFQLPLTIGGFGFAGYVLGGPIVHVKNGRLGRGAASFAMRVVVPAIVAATAVTVAGLEEDDRGYDGYFLGGFAAGAAIAVALDWWLLPPRARPRAHALRTAYRSK